MKRKHEGNFDREKSKRFQPNPMHEQAAEAQAIMQAFKKGDSASLAALKESLPQPLTMVAIETLLCQVNLFLRKNRRFADNLQKPLNALVALALNSTEHHLSQTTSADIALSDWLVPHLPKMRGQSIAFLIYNYGKIAGSSLNLPAVSANALIVLLQALGHVPIHSGKAIAISLYGIGLLIKAHRLTGVINTAVVEVLLEQLLKLGYLDTQDISNSLYGIGLLAQGGQLQGAIAAESLSVLLKRLRALGDLAAQHISNSLYGLGLLAKGGQLQGAIVAESVDALLKQLLALGDLTTQHIGNCLYGMGLLAQGGQLEGSIAAESLDALLKQLLVLGALETQHISNSVYGMGLLAKAGQLQGAIAAESLSLLINRLLALGDLTTQELSNILYGMGLLAKAGQLEGAIVAKSLDALLKQLLALGALDTQHISNSVYGLGLLAQDGHLQGAIAAESLSVLLKRLLEVGHLTTQGIANSLYSLGLLAQGGQLQGVIAAESLSVLLKRLCALGDLDTQNIGNSLYGLSLLAQSGHLQGAIVAESLSVLLKRLCALGDLDTQGIANSVYGLGLLAQSGHLHGAIAVESLSVLLKRLLELGDLDAQELNNSVYGLGLLAQAGQLQGAIAAKSVDALLKQLLALDDLATHELSNSFYGMGLLAKAGHLQGAIAAESLSVLLNRLLELGDLTTRGIAISLYSLGLLAQAGHLHGAIAAESLSVLLKRLLEVGDLTTQGISNSLYSLGLLAQGGHLQGAIAVESVDALLKQLLALGDLTTQGIANSVYSLGLLAQAGQLQGAIAAESLSILLKRLLELGDLTTQGIANSFYGLGLLATTGKLDGMLPTNSVERLLTRLQELSPTAVDARQMLPALTKLKPYYTQALSPEALAVIKRLFAASLHASYLHPSQAAELIHAMVAFKAYRDERMMPLFLEATESLGLPLACFSQGLQKQLQANLAALAGQPAWQRRLAQQLGLAPAPVITAVIPEVHEPIERARVASSQPRAPEKRPAVRAQSLAQKSGSSPSTYYSLACRNQLFSAIDKKDEANLRRLLGLIQATLAAPKNTKRTKSSSDRPADRHAAPKLYSAEQLVLEFFTQINKQALRELIAKSQTKPFVLCLQVCSAHARYQLVQTQALHPLFIHLPFQELETLVNTMISPFQIYRDHKALLQLIDALTIRKAKEPSNAQAIKGIQLQLVNEGLKFHQKCSHLHVVNRLNMTQTKIKENRLTLLDDNEHSEIPSPVSTQSALSKPHVPQARQASSSKAAAPKSGLQEVNSNYQYETEDIQAILAARVSVFRRVHVLAVAQMDAQITGNWVADVLTGFIDKEGPTLALNNEKRYLLIPIQDEGHWVGLIVTLQGKLCQGLTYFNSLDQGAKDKERMDSLQAQLEPFGFANQQTRVQPPIQSVMLQSDGTSCGPLMIENFYRALKGERWTQDNPVTKEMTQAIRKYHLEVLKEKRPDYYPDFKRRQANNIVTIPEIALQLQSHGLFPKVAAQRPEKTLEVIATNIRKPG